jgi:uncharacterized repeat protein (TIGR01451 family)
MKKHNLSYLIYLLRISAILCLLSSYLWIAPSQVHASSAGSQDSVLHNEGQTYATAAAVADNQMVYYGPWKNGYKAGLLNPVQPTTEVYDDSASNEQTQPPTFALSLGEHLGSTDPLQTDRLSLSISKGDVPQAPGESDPSAPLQAGPALAVEIISSPYATVDQNGNTLSGELPGVFVVEAVITNTGDATATNVEIELDYGDPSSGWVLYEGETTVRKPGDLASQEVYYAYWLARYPEDEDDYDPPPPVYSTTHQYTVTARADNIVSPVATAENFYEPNLDWTVRITESLTTANSKLDETSFEIVVGAAFTVTQVYTTGSNPGQAIFSPVGNITGFRPDAYRLLTTEARFFDLDGPQEMTATDRLYFPEVPDWVDKAEVTYTFIALLAENTTLCPYATFGYDGNPKYDKNFCGTGFQIPITGTLTLSQTKQVSSATIEQGQWLTYTIHYTNTGDKALQYAWIWDDVPTDTVSIVTDSIDPAPTLTTSSRIAWNPGTIPPTSTHTLTFTVFVDGNGDDLPDETDVVNSAFFGIVPLGSSLGERIALSSTVSTIVEAPMIALSKTDGQDTAQPGDLLTYTLLITNSGSVATSGLVITDDLPAGVTLAGTPTPGFIQNGQTLVWDGLGPISPDGGTLDVTIPVMVNLDVPDGTTLTNTATVVYKNASGEHTFAAETATDTTIVQAPVLTITKTAEDLDGPPLVVSDTIRYTLQVTNTGSIAAMGVTVTDDLPDQVTCQEVSFGSCDDPLVWEISSLAPDTTASLYITVTIDPGSEGQTITNTASVTGTDDPTPVCPDGSPPDPDTGECEITPEPPDTTLDFTKAAEDLDGPPLVVSDTIRYTLQVTNTGTYTAFDVTVTDDLPNGVTYVDASADQGGTSGTDPVVWTIPELPYGSNNVATLLITVTINEDQAGQSIINTGSVTGTNVPDPPDDPTKCPDGSLPDPDTGECPVTPEPSADLAVSKGVDDAAPEESDTIVYTITVTNNGPNDATGVVISDTLPGGVTHVTSFPTQGIYNDDTGEWDVGTLHDSDVATLTITAIVDEGTAGQTITNVAEVSASNEFDSDSGNNSDSVDITASKGGGIIYLPIILKNS